MFADTTELQVRWRTLTSAEVAKAELLLGDASREALRRFPDLQDRVDADPDLAADAAEVVCAAVRRRMTWEGDQTEPSAPDPDLETFSLAELRKLRGSVDPSDQAEQATALWSNVEEVAISGTGYLAGPPAVFGP